MANNLPEPTYDMTQQELYSVSDTMYGNLDANIADFAAYKPGKYVPAFVTALKAHRTSAMTMPDDDQRTSKYETLRTDLVKLRVNCTNNFEDLKGYIDDGFPDEQHKIKYEEAGGNFMRDALKNNWEKAVGLNKLMKDFIAAYPAELTAGFMPATFGPKVIADSGNFDTVYTNFKAARQTGVATGAKIVANNVIDADMKDLQSDAQKVYRNDSEKLKLFTITVLKDIVSPPGSASLKVTIKKKVTNEPKPDIPVTIQSKNGIAITLKTGADGIVLFEKIDPANYTVKIVNDNPPGETTLTKEVNTGVAARMEVALD